jgi:hypothetical protein
VKALLLVLASLVCVLAVFVGGLYVTAYVVADPEPHQFAHLESPDLWTSEPVKIDTSKQTYERLPSLPVVASIPASDLPVQKVADARQVGSEKLDASTTGSIEAKGDDEAATAVAQNQLVDSARAQWCFARYRSYRVEDNSYQPLSGGPRRQCTPPGGLVANVAMTRGERSEVVRETASAEWPPQSSNAGQARNHVDWCMARYRSYRMEDNSYQPFDGGPRRSCESPFG